MIKDFYRVSKCSECKHSFVADIGVSVQKLVWICGSKEEEVYDYIKPCCKSVVVDCVSFEFYEIK